MNGIGPRQPKSTVFQRLGEMAQHLLVVVRQSGALPWVARQAKQRKGYCMTRLPRHALDAALATMLITGSGAMVEASAGAIAYDASGEHQSASVGDGQYAVGEVVIASFDTS